MKLQDIKLNDNERQKCEIWTRVMGYYRPVENYNVGKLSEYKERTYFKEADITNNMNSSVNANESYGECNCFKESSCNTTSNNDLCEEIKDINNNTLNNNNVLHNKDNVLEDCTDCSKDINIKTTTGNECIRDSSIKKAS